LLANLGPLLSSFGRISTSFTLKLHQISPNFINNSNKFPPIATKHARTLFNIIQSSGTCKRATLLRKKLYFASLQMAFLANISLQLASIGAPNSQTPRALEREKEKATWAQMIDRSGVLFGVYSSAGFELKFEQNSSEFSGSLVLLSAA